MSIFDNIKQAEFTRIETTHSVRFNHPVMSSDGLSIWDRSEGWFWILLEPDGESFYVTLEAAGPVPPWMQYILDTEGLNGAMFPDCTDGEQFAKELLEMGLAPNQTIFVHMSFSAGQEYWTNESWEEVEWELLDAEKLSPKEKLDRWVEWLDIWTEGEPYLVGGV